MQALGPQHRFQLRRLQLRQFRLLPRATLSVRGLQHQSLQCSDDVVRLVPYTAIALAPDTPKREIADPPMNVGSWGVRFEAGNIRAPRTVARLVVRHLDGQPLLESHRM